MGVNDKTMGTGAQAATMRHTVNMRRVYTTALELGMSKSIEPQYTRMEREHLCHRQDFLLKDLGVKKRVRAQDKQAAAEKAEQDGGAEIFVPDHNYHTNSRPYSCMMILCCPHAWQHRPALRRSVLLQQQAYGVPGLKIPTCLASSRPRLGEAWGGPLAEWAYPSWQRVLPSYGGGGCSMNSQGLLENGEGIAWKKCFGVILWRMQYDGVGDQE
eukprot:scaffold188566_cov22-Tisochrysis_lutea.AAC.2